MSRKQHVRNGKLGKAARKEVADTGETRNHIHQSWLGQQGRGKHPEQSYTGQRPTSVPAGSTP
jgi:hypothetical protein